MPGALTAQRTNPESDTIQVSWQKESHLQGTRWNDELMAISYDGENFSEMAPTCIRRKDLQGTFELTGNVLRADYIYLFFASEDRRSFSESLALKI